MVNGVAGLIERVVMKDHPDITWVSRIELGQKISCSGATWATKINKLGNRQQCVRLAFGMTFFALDRDFSLFVVIGHETRIHPFGGRSNKIEWRNMRLGLLCLPPANPADQDRAADQPVRKLRLMKGF